MAKSRVSSKVDTLPSPYGDGEHENPDLKPEKGKGAKGGQIAIPELNFQAVRFKIIGDSPLLIHRFSQKTQRIFEEEREIDQETSDKKAGQSRARRPKPARDFEQEFRDSLYPLDGIKGAYGFPAMGFKHAIEGACRYATHLDMTLARRNIFVKADSTSEGYGMIRIHGKPQMQKIPVMIGKFPNKVPDIRSRAMIYPWWAELVIEYNANLITPIVMFRLLQHAGKCEGNGEQRPSSPNRSGDNGTWHPAGEGE